MAEKKLVEAITSMEEDFAQWYTDVVKKAELMDYSSVKGCMIFKPNGYSFEGLRIFCIFTRQKYNVYEKAFSMLDNNIRAFHWGEC